MTVTVNESYAVYDGSKFYRATQAAPTTATTEEITDKKTINHLYVTGENVPAPSMQRCTALTSVAMPDVKIIGANAFLLCTALNSVEMPDATDIGNSAFWGCAALTTVTMPSATSIIATTIGNSAFSGCTALTNVKMPKATTI
ncbi:MAG: leucine-rich repeat domain-containing protein, partial [Oscillospiraceae bacterium]